jgi:hypothetical protein
LSFLCILSLPAAAQSAIAGRVTDSEGAVIAKARVLVHWDSSGSKVGLTANVGTTKDVSVLTDANGDYSAGVPAGFYDVFVTAGMFTPAAVKVIVRQGQRATFRVKLKIDPLVSKEIGGMRVVRSAVKDLTGEKVRRENALDSSGCNSRPQTGSFHPVAEAAISSFDLLKRGGFSQCVDPAEGFDSYRATHPCSAFVCFEFSASVLPSPFCFFESGLSRLVTNNVPIDTTTGYGPGITGNTDQ